MNSDILEYELVDISFELPYELPEEGLSLVREDGPAEKNVPQVVFDADGVPMGNSPEDIKLRKQIIFQFYEKWKAAHPEKSVFNNNLNAEILIRKESVVEASGHAPKRYKSTLAVLRLDELLMNAVQVGIDNPKPDNKNQRKLSKMILMTYVFTDLGTVKLTVGVRRQTKDLIQYGVTVLEEGETVLSHVKNAKKKASHKK